MVLDLCMIDFRFFSLAMMIISFRALQHMNKKITDEAKNYSILSSFHWLPFKQSNKQTHQTN